MNANIMVALRAIGLFTVIAFTLIGIAPDGAFAQGKPQIQLTLNRDHLIAGEPLLLRYQITGVPENTSLVIKNRDKGWINIRLLDADGKEVGSASDDKLGGSSDGAHPETATDAFTDDTGLVYSVPKMSSDHRIIVPQTDKVTKAGVFRLLVRVRLLAALRRKNVSSQGKNSSGELNEMDTEPDEKAFRPMKVSMAFRVVVTSVEPSALSEKAVELRNTFLTLRGPERLDAARELIDWPSDQAVHQWQLLAKDPNCKPADLAMFAGMIAVVGSHDAIQFLGALTWDMNKLNMRGSLTNMYWTSQDPVQRKQIAALFATHGEEVPRNVRLVID